MNGPTGVPSAAGETGATMPLASLATETVRPELSNLDTLDVEQLVRLMGQEPLRAVEAVQAAALEIVAATELIVAALETGGRMAYVGAGSAGRLGVLDASELGPTFNVPEGVVEAVIAGGDVALRHAVEGAEDDLVAGGEAMKSLRIGAHDVVVGISASGRTPFVIGALQEARRLGAATVAVSCTRSSPMSQAADRAIETVVGGELVAGSSRLNAGTAQKIVLNTLSTAVMVRLGKTYGNLMVEVRPTNSKLRDRAARIVAQVAHVGTDEAVRALVQCGWETKLACLVAWSGQAPHDVAPVLDQCRGHLRPAMEQLARSTTG